MQYLLSGTVRWDREGGGSRVRVSPELIDVFQVQADVAERVARELGVALAGWGHDNITVVLARMVGA